MARIDSEIIKNQLNWRYACKKFDNTKKIPDTDWNVLVESLRLSASSYGLQPWKFIVVQDRTLREQLLPWAWGQTPVTDSSHFIVFTYKEKLDEAHIEKHIQQMANVQGISVSALDRFKKNIIGELIEGPRSETIQWWAQRQTYIAMGSLLTTAALLEIDTLPMEGLNPTEFDKILKIDGTGWRTVAAVACGYRSSEDKYQYGKKVRFDLDEILEFR